MNVSLTDREADIMQVLWEHGPCTAAGVREHLTDMLAYTTVQTMLRILESKGYVRHKEQGRVHHYAAAVKQQAARTSALKHLTEKLFKGSSELLFAQLVSDRKLSDEQIQRMRQMLAEEDRKENK